MGVGPGLGVEPDGVGQHVAVDQQAVVMRFALPGAGGLVVAEGVVLALERVLGEVVVAFHQHGVVTLGDDGVVPGGFHDSYCFLDCHLLNATSDLVRCFILAMKYGKYRTRFSGEENLSSSPILSPIVISRVFARHLSS